MGKGLTEQQIEKMKEYGVYSGSCLADELSDLLALEELWGDYTVSEAVSRVYEELAKLRKARELLERVNNE